MGFDDIVLEHLDRYPMMQSIDAVVLAFQNACGPSRLAKDAVKARKVFLQEWHHSVQNDDPIYIPIGNGMCRVSLYRCRLAGLNPEDIFGLYADLLSNPLPDKDRILEEHLNTLAMMAEEGRIPFTSIDFLTFLAMGKMKTQPVHSDIYRNTYHPDYCIVQQHALKKLIRSARSSQRTL